MDNWKVIITTRCLNTNITQDEITLEVLTTDSTAARRVAMQRLYRDKHIAALDAENAQLRDKLVGECRDAAFYKCCALSGEIPSPGSEPSARDKALTEGERNES